MEQSAMNEFCTHVRMCLLSLKTEHVHLDKNNNTCNNSVVCVSVFNNQY